MNIIQLVSINIQIKLFYMKKYLIVYHQEDNDGVFSAAIIKHYLMTSLNVSKDEITYNSLNKLQANGTVENWSNEYNHIIITDISFNDWKVMKWLSKTFGENFTWIDHHAPIINISIKEGFDNVNGIRDSANSAIWNAYKYLYDPFMEKQFPFVVKMLSAWDSWTYEREGIETEWCRAFNKGFTICSELSVAWYIERINMFLGNHTYDGEGYIKSIEKIGREACEREDNANKELIRTNGDKEWTVNGIPAIMVVTTGGTNSLMFKSLQLENHTETDLRVAAVFKHCSDGNWTLSLYNIYDLKGDTSNPMYFHCGKYLQEKYNGGGHEGAAGCTITVDKFCKMLKSKTI